MATYTLSIFDRAYSWIYDMNRDGFHSNYEIETIIRILNNYFSDISEYEVKSYLYILFNDYFLSKTEDISNKMDLSKIDVEKKIELLCFLLLILKYTIEAKRYYIGNTYIVLKKLEDRNDLFGQITRLNSRLNSNSITSQMIYSRLEHLLSLCGVKSEKNLLDFSKIDSGRAVEILAGIYILSKIRLEKETLTPFFIKWKRGIGKNKNPVTNFVSGFFTFQYSDEEVKSSYGYPSGYKPKGITMQTNKLRELFPGIGYANEKLAEGTLPENAEGWFAIPRWEKVAPTYGQAVQKVFDLIKKTRKVAFHNCREGELGSNQLRQSQKSTAIFQKLGDEQKEYDILVVPAQFGIRHRGRSVRRARALMNTNECGLGAFAIGIMLLTHPQRLQRYIDLWIDCGGDEFAPGAGGDFSGSSYFEFLGGRVQFDARGVGHAYDRFGSASACFWLLDPWILERVCESKPSFLLP